MTPPSDSETVAQEAPPATESGKFKKAVRAQVRRELEVIATGLEEHADRLIKLYGDITMDGEAQAHTYRTVARDLRNRIRSNL